MGSGNLIFLHDEREFEVYQRENVDRSKEQNERRGESPEDGGTRELQYCNRESAPSTGGEKRGGTVCTREPSDERPVEDEGSNGQTRERRIGVDTDNSGSMCIWEEVQETNEDPHKHEEVDPEGDNRNREMQNTGVCGHQEQPERPGGGEARATNDCDGPQEGPERGREDRRLQQEGIQHKGIQEPGGKGSDHRNSEGSYRRKRERVKQGEEKEDNGKRRKLNKEVRTKRKPNKTDSPGGPKPRTNKKLKTKHDRYGSQEEGDRIRAQGGQNKKGSEGTVGIRPHQGGGGQLIENHKEYQDHGSELRRRIRKGVG